MNRMDTKEMRIFISQQMYISSTFGVRSANVIFITNKCYLLVAAVFYIEIHNYLRKKLSGVLLIRNGNTHERII